MTFQANRRQGSGWDAEAVARPDFKRLRLHSLEKQLESLIIRLNCLENKIHFLLFCQQSKKNMMTLAATQY